MIDHILGRPSTRLKRLQVIVVLAFWAAVLKRGPRQAPARSKWLKWADRRLGLYSPWKVVLSTLMCLYAVRHVDSLLGYGGPEPLAAMYSRSFYRVTWILTALDAGFATALNVRPLWLRDILSVVFSAYYIIYANEADEKLRRYRAFCTLDMMRYTWEKTSNNPYIRLATWFHRPSLPIARQILLPRPIVGAYSKRPIKAWLFYARGKEEELVREEELYLDFPGGGFICMSPRDHEERLRQLAKEVGRPILAIDYCKAPEYPYPFALEECFDVYRTLIETRGKAIGMAGNSRFRIVLSGDSAGGNLATGVMLKILEYPEPHIKTAYAALGGSSKPPPLPKPLCMILAYPSLNFSFTAWMQPDHLRVLKAQSEVNLQNLQLQAAQAQDDSKAGRRGSPLRPRSRSRSRQNSSASLSAVKVEQSQPSQQKTRAHGGLLPKDKSPSTSSDKSYTSLANQAQLHLAERARLADAEPASDDNSSPLQTPRYTTAADTQDRENLAWQSDRWYAGSEDEERQRQLAASQQKVDAERNERRQKAPSGGTRLTMTSMAGYFQDRILTQSMMRSMALLYVGPRRQPDFEREYLLSPIVAPAKLLAEFPPVLFICGEKDPICDDTVVFAGRIREAKLAKQAEIKHRKAGASAKFGEGLRMSVGGSARRTGGEADAEGAAIDPIEEEDVEDWVQMRIIASVSHGLLQMSALWPEAKHIISFIAAWVVETFEEEQDRLAEIGQQQQQQQGSSRYAPLKTQTMPPPASRARDRQDTGKLRRQNGSASGNPPSDGSDGRSGAGLTVASGPETMPAGAVADEEEGDEPLSFTPKRMRSPSVQSPRTSIPGDASPFPGGPSASSSASLRSNAQSGQGIGATGRAPPRGPLQLPAIAALKGEPSGPGGPYQGTAATIDKQQCGGGGDTAVSGVKVGSTSRSTTAHGASVVSARSRPNSFSDVRATRAEVASTAGLKPPLRDDEHRTATDVGGGPGSGREMVAGVRRSSFGGLARSRSPNEASGSRSTGVSQGAEKGTMDSRTRALLINESSLLQRRREEAEAVLGLRVGLGGLQEELAQVRAHSFRQDDDGKKQKQKQQEAEEEEEDDQRSFDDLDSKGGRNYRGRGLEGNASGAQWQSGGQSNSAVESESEGYDDDDVEEDGEERSRQDQLSGSTRGRR